MAIVIIVLWSAIGLVAGIVLATEIGPAFGYRHMEGSSAIFGMLSGAPLGAVLGGVFGFTMSRRLAADAKKRRLFLGGTLLTIAGLVMAGVLFETIRTSDWLDGNGTAVSLPFEVRLPAGITAPRMNDVSIELRSDKGTRKASMYESVWLRRDGDRVVMGGNFELYRATPNRVVAVRIGDGPTLLFRLKIPERPTKASGYGTWSAVDEVEDTTSGKRAPKPQELAEIRTMW